MRIAISQLVQDKKWATLLIAAIEGDCRSTYEGMIELFAKHISANEIELKLQSIADSTIVPAFELKNGLGRPKLDQTLNSSGPVAAPRVVSPKKAETRRALKVQPRSNRSSLAKFSQEWLNHCRAKYNSFNPRTGKYRGFDGTFRDCL